jgi:hypothetical protein
LRTVRARSSFEPLHGEALAGRSSNESHPTDAGGRHYASDPTRTPKRYGSAAVSAPSLKQACLKERDRVNKRELLFVRKDDRREPLAPVRRARVSESARGQGGAPAATRGRTTLRPEPRHAECSGCQWRQCAEFDHLWFTLGSEKVVGAGSAAQACLRRGGSA